MYANFFGLSQAPFSIAPDPRYLFLSDRHREALAHLRYGLGAGGGFVLLSGEIGAGKTTVCRCLLEQVPPECRVAYLFNPQLDPIELLQTICQEFGIAVTDGVMRSKPLIDALNAHLLAGHAAGRSHVLIIDEAQQLKPKVLEQLRLLTNLETDERKLLQIILIGQPELRQLLARPELEQLAQRVIARYHLDALSSEETARYVEHRLRVAGLRGPLPFDARALRLIHQLSRGVPRRVNLLCDRALLGAYAQQRHQVDRRTLRQAAAEVFGGEAARPRGERWRGAAGLAAVGGLGLLLAWGLAAQRERSGGATGASRPAAALPASGASSPAPPPVPAQALAASGVSAPKSAGSAPAAPAVAAIAEAVAPQRWDDEATAVLALAAHWEPALVQQLAPGDAPCAALLDQRLPCWRGDGGLALLRLLDRPALLKLRGASSKPQWVLLLALGPDEAWLAASQGRFRIKLPDLLAQWPGEIATLWRAPPLWVPRQFPDDWLQALDAQLASVLALEPLRPQRYDAALQQRIARFQRSQGLHADGLAGPVTLMQLNRAAAVPEPRLTPP